MDTEEKLTAYIEGVAMTMDSRIAATLKQIETRHRQLLALRGYLAHEELVNSRWTWTDEEAKAYYATQRYKDALVEAAKVKKEFEAMMRTEAMQNASLKGHTYSLTYKRKHRDMNEQLKGWNGNDKVNTIAMNMWAKTLKEIAGAGYSDPPDATSLAKFTVYVKSFKLSASPPRATPGLSDHGRFHAFDFKVTEDGKVIADTTTATIKKKWDEPGWKDRLHEAVKEAKAKFDGPLKNPNEPWHYRYTGSEAD